MTSSNPLGIDAIVFDFDGTILDTESAGLEAWEKVFAEYNVPFPFDQWQQNVGGEDIFLPEAYLVEKTGIEASLLSLREQRETFKLEIIANKKVFPGVVDQIQQAKTLGLKLAVASSSTARWLNYHLPRIGLLYEFEAVRGSSDVGGRMKPDPAVYLAACEGLGVDPAKALAFEDTYSGITAAKAAGMYAVAIPNAITKTMDFSQADLILNSLADYSLVEILEQVAQKSR